MKAFPILYGIVLLVAVAPGCRTSAPASAGKGASIKMNHLAFHVTDLAKSTDFYTRIIGLDTIPEPFHDGRHTWLSLGDGSHLHLIQAAGVPVIPGKNTHLCLSVRDVSVLTALFDRSNIPFEDWAGTRGAVTTRVDGVKQLYLQDPDGYWLEINDARR